MKKKAAVQDGLHMCDIRIHKELGLSTECVVELVRELLPTWHEIVRRRPADTPVVTAVCVHPKAAVGFVSEDDAKKTYVLVGPSALAEELRAYFLRQGHPISHAAPLVA